MWRTEHLAHTGLQRGQCVFTVRRRDTQLLVIDALIFRRKWGWSEAGGRGRVFFFFYSALAEREPGTTPLASLLSPLPSILTWSPSLHSPTPSLISILQILCLQTTFSIGFSGGLIECVCVQSLCDANNCPLAMFF